MASFTTFDAPTGVAVGSGGRQASAADFGPAEGIKSFGKSLGQAGEVIKVREDKRSITQARAGFADTRLQFEQEQAVRRQEAPLSAEGFVEQTKAEYDTAMANFKGNLNDVQVNALAADMASSRLTTMRGAISFKAQQMVKADLVDIGKIQEDIQSRLAKGEITYEEANLELEDKLLDTTINAVGQETISTAALPDFRQSITNGYLDNPIVGLQALKAGALDFLPEEEKNKFETDLYGAIAGLEKRRTQERFGDAAVKNSAAFKEAYSGGSVADFDKFKGKLSPEVYNTLRKQVVERNIPYRTLEEKIAGFNELSARYAQLGVKMKKGNRTAEADLQDLIAFQTYAMTRAGDGWVTSGEAARYVNKIEEIVQKGLPKAGTMVDLLPFFDIFDDDPFSVGMEAVNEHVTTNGLSAAANAAIARRFQTGLEEANITPGAAQTETRDQLVNKIAKQAIDDHVRATNPQMRHMEELPNAMIDRTGKVVHGTPGEGKGKANKKISGPEIVMDKNGQHARVMLDAKGNIDPDSVELLTPEEALRTKPAVEPEAPATPTSNGTQDQDPEPLRAVTDVPPPLAAQFDAPVEAAPTAIVDPDAFPDDPGRAGLTLVIPPAEQAIDIVKAGLIANEGTGDIITGIPTGEGGITEVRKADIERRKGRPLTDAQARSEAVREDSAALHDRMPGFDTLGAKVQAAVIDLTYNIGVNTVLDPVQFPKLQKAIAAGDVPAILRNTLDTAVVEKKSVRGLALRRARMFNQANTDPKLNISDVEQLKDGTINYLSGNRVVFTFKRPRHQDSRAGSTPVTTKAA